MKKLKIDYHQPVLLKEVADGLFPGKQIAHLNQVRVIDATVGFGGHTIEFAKLGIDVLGIDQSLETLKITGEILKKACPSPKHKFGRVVLINSNFSEILSVAEKNGFSQVDGILFDLGVSNYQLTSDTQGFSFANPNAVLDMRMDPQTNAVKASDLLNALPKDKLFSLFSKVLPYKKSVLIAQNICEYRKMKGGFQYVSDFLTVIPERNNLPKHINPATKYFLALRMAVNSELENLTLALPQAFCLLKKGGRLAVITFHSLEDKIVKDFIRISTADGKAKKITKKPIVASQQEVQTNSRSRSAKLRIVEKA